MSTPTIGLALGGGGARGLAHLVVLEALEGLGLRPALISGTSMGALIGGAYAAGLRPKDIRAHLLRVLRNRRLVLGHVLDARVGRFVDILTRGLVNPVLIDIERALPVFWPGPVPARFEDLTIPLAVIATDFDARSAVVMRTGTLPDALAASSAVPGLARPIRRAGRLLIDGGAVDPLPYEMLFGEVDLVLACDVSPGRTDEPAADPQAFAVMLAAAQIMQTALTNRMLQARPPHLVIRPPVERFRLLDYFYASRILEAADAALDTIKRDIAGLVEARVRA